MHLDVYVHVCHGHCPFCIQVIRVLTSLSNPGCLQALGRPWEALFRFTRGHDNNDAPQDLQAQNRTARVEGPSAMKGLSECMPRNAGPVWVAGAMAVMMRTMMTTTDTMAQGPARHTDDGHVLFFQGSAAGPGGCRTSRPRASMIPGPSRPMTSGAQDFEAEALQVQRTPQHWGGCRGFPPGAMCTRSRFAGTSPGAHRWSAVLGRL